MTFSHSVVPTHERERAIATIVAAFMTDPIVRWIYPDAAQYQTAFPRIIEAFGGKAFDAGTAYSFEQPVAVALWLGPGIQPDSEAMGQIIGDTVEPRILDDLGEFAAQQAAMHPHEPHWYLPLIGVDPAHQGNGLGSALMSHALAISDKAGLPAYLEATSDRSRRLYERHGFEVVGEVQYGSSPPMWPMRHQPRPS
jgi:ribosomal protein S18 acetylase RimI-like enzyme